MEISIAGSRFIETLAGLVPITKGMRSMPVLANVLVSFEDCRAHFVATDLEISIITSVDLADGAPKRGPRICVNAEQVAKTASKMGDPVWILVPGPDSDESGSVIIHNSECHYSFAQADAADFPEVAPIPMAGSVNLPIPAPDFRRAMDRVLYAVSRDDSRFTLTGVYLKLTSGILYAVATDGFREAVAPVSIEGAATVPGVIVPRRAIEYVMARMPGEGNIVVTIGADKIQFGFGAVTIISRVIGGNFPEWENVIPVNEYTCRVKRAPLLQALRRVLTVCDQQNHNTIDVTFGPLVTVAVEGPLGSGSEAIPGAEWSGGPEDGEAAQAITLAVNAKYLADAVSRVEGADVSFSIPAAYRAILITDGDYRQIIMPIRN